MTTFITPTFDFSGDLEWAAWSKGVLCSDDACQTANVEAIGVSVTHSADRIEVRPVCETCATDRNILLFEEEN